MSGPLCVLCLGGKTDADLPLACLRCDGQGTEPDAAKPLPAALLREILRMADGERA